MKKQVEQFEGMNVTLNVTENCNLRCKYCYETCKTPKRADYDTCVKFIDWVLQEGVLKSSDPNMDKVLHQGIVFDFIGGDAFTEIDLLEKLFRYITYKMSSISNERFLKGYRFNVCSNGTLFERKKVRDFCEKWKDNLFVNVSIDGCPEIHDLNRVYENGLGSMETILKWWPWFKKTFPTGARGTKSTCSKNSIPYLYDSLKFMHETLEMDNIMQNFIMEDTGCTEEDYQELDRQMGLCVDYMLEHRDELYWSMIEDDFRLREDFEPNTETNCGSGWMPTMSIEGDVYPCFRWLPASQNGDRGIMSAGNVNNNDLDTEIFKFVQVASKRRICTRNSECFNCPYDLVCPYCIAGGYAEYSTFWRPTHICRITKIRCRHSEDYWRRYNADQA